MGNDTVLEAIGKGSIKATMQVGGQFTHTTITQVLHVPKMKNNLISVSKLISEGFKVEFDKDGRKVKDARRVVGDTQERFFKLLKASSFKSNFKFVQESFSSL
jgi:hypothetical protein